MTKLKKITLQNHVQQTLDDYFANLEGHNPPPNFYDLVLQEMEAPLFKAVLKHTNNNQSIAAQILGISRGTLRKKIQNLN
jgi:Fis family transcriptional regulator